MQILNPYYTDYAPVESVEELFLVFARGLLQLQSTDKNSNKLDYIDISSNEDNKISTVEIRSVPSKFIDTGLEIINLFNGDTIVSDTSGTFTIPYPFGQPSLLSALCKLGIWLADKELESSLNPQGKKVFSYSLTSNRTIGDLPLLLSISARDLPLEFESAGAWQSSRAKAWLSGSV